jgi:hypothetical protein
MIASDGRGWRFARENDGEFVLLHFRAGPRDERDAQNVFARNAMKIVYCLVVVPTLLQSPGDQL